MAAPIAKSTHRANGIGPELLVGLGLGFNSAWVSMAFKSLTLYGSAAEGPGAEPVLDGVYLISIISVCITLLVASLFQKRTWVVLAHFPTFIAMAVGMAITTAFMPLGDPTGSQLHQLIMVLAGVLSGFFSGLYLLYFGMVFTQLTLRGRVVAAAAGTILSSLLFLAFNALPAPAALGVAMGCPLLSALFLALGSMRAPLQNGLGSSPTDDAFSQGGFPRAFGAAILRCQPKPIEDAHEKASWRNLIMRIALASALVGFASEGVRTLYVQMDLVSAGQYAYAGFKAADSLIATILVVALALLLITRRTERMAKDCYFVICIILAMGILLLPLPLIFPGVDSYIPLAISSAAYGAFGMFVWVLSACICASYPSATIAGFAAIRAAWALGPLVGLVSGRALLSTLGLSVQSAFIAMLAGIFSLLIVMSFVFSEGDLGRIMAIVPTRVQARFRSKCELVAKRYDLTERESEIMMMLAKGRNLAYIQDQLFVSKSTVSTHRQHIYQKTGVHSQQELIDLVQEAE
ncbi:MAG: response regulator transcription factor [Eggerthellaceae bacterium]|nr:response regulator transcription factor [Eggerthellaceae bacterium]